MVGPIRLVVTLSRIISWIINAPPWLLLWLSGASDYYFFFGRLGSLRASGGLVSVFSP